ncbi:MAG: NUMOD3 domain-containing DNA-binding protein [Patescibacteria group bacterium]
MPTGVYQRKPFSRETIEKIRKSNIGKKRSEETRRKISEAHKGLKPNLETRMKMSLAHKGKTSPASIAALIQANEERRGKPQWWQRGDRHYNWKGDKVKYRSLHTWVEKRLGKPDGCEFCGRKATGRQINWANKSGEYKRDLSDWICLCVPCHTQYDQLRRNKNP